MFVEVPKCISIRNVCQAMLARLAGALEHTSRLENQDQQEYKNKRNEYHSWFQMEQGTAVSTTTFFLNQYFLKT